MEALYPFSPYSMAGKIIQITCGRASEGHLLYALTKDGEIYQKLSNSTNWTKTILCFPYQEHPIAETID